MMKDSGLIAAERAFLSALWHRIPNQSGSAKLIWNEVTNRPHDQTIQEIKLMVTAAQQFLEYAERKVLVE